jgi:hypothetical protein
MSVFSFACLPTAFPELRTFPKNAMVMTDFFFRVLFNLVGVRVCLGNVRELQCGTAVRGIV